MKAFGLVGWSGAGKTTLLARLIPALTARGLTVSTVKHAHHRFDLDQPGKDSWRHREAGANEVMVASSGRWALLHEHRDPVDPCLEALLGHLSPVDLVLVEGFKAAPIPKLEVWRRATGKPQLCRDDRHIIALAGDKPFEPIPVPRFDLDAVPAIATFIIATCGLEPE